MTPLVPLVKGITLWQPWASLIALLLKENETRGHASYWSGTLIIHAAATTTGLYLAAKEPIIVHALAQRAGLVLGALPLGKIVCHATLHRSLRIVPDGTPTKPGVTLDASTLTPLERACGDYRPDRHAWPLTDVVPTPHVPYKGSQGFWFPTPELLAELGLQHLQQ